ncbi:hypothetical protein K492DRAFT_196011 [Lichtheimia hyalospora FSU 10163]|nr:hypothetical protein K492DRAFT_196011 [Lichtheimia hyalospora FSU 10163]
MRLSLLTLSVAACLVGSVSQIAHADPCTEIQSNCVKSPFNELGIQCSKGGDLTIFGKNECCCKNEPEPAPSDKGNPPPTTPAPKPKPNPNKGKPGPRRKGGQGPRVVRIPRQCMRFRTWQRRYQCAIRQRQRQRQGPRQGPRPRQ